MVKESSIVGYCRSAAYSTASMTAQLDQIKKHATGNNVVFYYDNGFSGSNLKRPALTRLLRNVRQRKVAKVIVTDYQCIARKPALLHSILRILEQYGVQVVSLNNEPLWLNSDGLYV